MMQCSLTMQCGESLTVRLGVSLYGAATALRTIEDNAFRKKETTMSLATEISRGTRRAVDAGSADFNRFRGRLEKNMRHARKSATRRIETTDRYVHEHPWMAMAVVAAAAAVAGVAAARLLGRGHSTGFGEH